MTKDLLVLRNKTSLLKTKEFFSNAEIDAYYQEISYSKPIDINLNNVDAEIILVTSQNALYTLKNNLEYFNFKRIYCLNSDIANNIKADNIIWLGWNNTSELSDYLIQNEDKNKKIVHLCADNANKNFYDKLQKYGFNINGVNVYKTKFVKEINSEVTSKLINKEIKSIMLFSSSSLKALKVIFNKYNLNEIDYNYICFSKNIANHIINSTYPKNSNLKEMLDLYKKEKSHG